MKGSAFFLVMLALFGRGNSERKQELDRLLRILPKSDPWEKWVEETGELPPDFDSMPSIPGLPDPLLMEKAGRSVPITTPQEWQQRRGEIKELFHRYVIGTVPPPPGNVRGVIVDSREEEGSTVQEITLEFGPGHRARLRMELIIPRAEGPFPVFMTQHNHRAWALIAVRRGYVGCIYAGADSRDDTDGFLEVYPEYDWSRLTRRGWAGSRCIDYLETLPFVDSEKIALTGHSRNGKQSLIAAALDERISVVIPSSSGAGGAMPYRCFAEEHFGEGIELLTRVFPDWFHPRLRFFSGRENKLPVDNHELVALCAPRACLISTALNDSVCSTWATQQTYLAAKPVYKLLGAEDKLRILWRPGSHETWPTIIETYLDFCDTHFGRKEYDFPERLIHPHDFDEWKETSGEKVDLASFQERGLDDLMNLEDGALVRSSQDWERRRAEMREKVQWMLGEEPPSAQNPGGRYGAESPHIASLMGRSSAGEGLEKRSIIFGDYIVGDIYMPERLADSDRKAPGVLWLHPFSFARGYVAGYRRGEQFFRALAREGFVVFCFDQIGFGRRIEEVERFYQRYPRWSLMGKMVCDARAALDVFLELPYVEKDQVYGVGYALGGMVGLHLAAFDDRLAGFASVCGFTPMRLDTQERKIGGIGRWSHDYMLIPKLGFFIGNEGRIPYDFHTLLAIAAPRPVLVISPKIDRYASLDDITRCVKEAKRAYALSGAEDNLRQEVPDDYNRFGPEMQNIVLNWLKMIKD
jgi:pimeloyl-ACP methyl ester carboxylesterase